jgi:predicted ATP-binding protein involved in virulence
MRIDKLTLINFRCFQGLTLELHPSLTVLVGENASGKTAVLEGLAAGLAAFFMGIPDAHTSSGSIDRRDVRTVLSEKAGVVSVEPQYPCHIQCVGSVLPGRQVGWHRDLLSPRSRTTRQHAETAKRSAMALLNWIDRGEDVRLPVIAYYGTQRLWRVKKDTSGKRDMRSRFAGYWDCLSPSSDQKHLVAWMRWQTYGALQAGKPSPHLEAIARAVHDCVEGLEDFFYDVKKESLFLVWEDGQRQPFDQLSDGYRNLVAMVADIAWRAVVLSPQDGTEAPVKATGVVLVDEIDLHLHPRWQIRVLDDLRRAFPGIQFVVTTHAPQVIGATPAECLRVLARDFSVKRVGHAYGLDTNTVLQTIMGAGERRRDVEDKLHELGMAVEARDWGKVEAFLSELEPLLGEIYPDLVSARWERDFAKRG